MADLEDRTVEKLPATCENCGTTLTESEKQLALESGATPVLCTVCAAEDEPAVEAAEDLDPEL